MFNFLQKKRGKRIVCLILAGVLLLSLISCRDGADMTESIGTLEGIDSAFETADPVVTDTDPAGSTTEPVETPAPDGDPIPSETGSAEADPEPTTSKAPTTTVTPDPEPTVSDKAPEPTVSDADPAPSSKDPDPTVSDADPKPSDTDLDPEPSTSTDPAPAVSDPEPAVSDEPPAESSKDPEPTVSDKDPEPTPSETPSTGTTPGAGNMDDSAALDEEPGPLTTADIVDLTKDWDTDEFKKEVAQWVVYYINQYRAEEGTPELTVLPGMTLVSEYRADQIITNFSHDTADIREAAAAHEYGVWKDATLWGLDASESYWSIPGAMEAITRIRTNYQCSTEDIGRTFADSIRNSSSHWSYVGSDDQLYIAVGTEYNPSTYCNWYCCIMVSECAYE